MAPTDSHNLHQAQQPAAPSLGGFTYFTPFQAEIVNAAAGRIIPSDANGPGAIEAGVVFFIDRQLSASYNFFGRQRLLYRRIQQRQLRSLRARFLWWRSRLGE